MPLSRATASALEPSIELADLLGHTMRRVHRGTRAALAPLGLSVSDARVVRLLADGPLRMSAITERLAVVPRAATDMVDGVEVAGLVTRRAAPQDRRAVLAEAEFGVLSPAQRDDLAGLLRTLCERGGCPACAADTAPKRVATAVDAVARTTTKRGRTLAERPARRG